MTANYLNSEIILLCVLSLVPWPGPSIFKISCPRDDARTVRKVVQSKWVPVLEKYGVSVPLECPFHPTRDIYGPQEKVKHQHRSSQWTCGLCGKSFFEERYLDMHFDNRHNSYTNMAEDAVCFADYCDMMRCDVLRTQDHKIPSEMSNTDIEVWRESAAYKTELEMASPRSLTKYVGQNRSKEARKKMERCHKFEFADGKTDKGEVDKSQNASNTCQTDMIDSASPSVINLMHQRNVHIQHLKANCKPEELQKLRTKCEILVRDCIAGLLVNLSLKDFKEIEEELNRATCWYLTCDRYWEESQGDLKQFPWGLVCMIVMVLSLGICICYYIIWILFDTDDVSVTSTSLTDCSSPSPAHFVRHDPSQPTNSHQSDYSEEYYTATEKDNECIYVTYPADLKLRLLESCYNRTTRL